MRLGQLKTKGDNWRRAAEGLTLLRIGEKKYDGDNYLYTQFAQSYLKSSVQDRAEKLAKMGVSSDSGKMKFSTDEWLGMIADEFTFPKERKVTRAIVNYLETVYTKQQAVLVVYDTRFLALGVCPHSSPSPS